MGVKQLLLIIALVVLVGCGTTSWVSDPSNPNNVIIEKVIREAAKKPRGELTKADLEKVTKLELFNNQLTNVKDLEKLTQLEWLDLSDNQLSDLKGLEKLTQLKTLVLISFLQSAHLDMAMRLFYPMSGQGRTNKSG